MAEYVGEACAQVRVRKRSLMYIGPPQTQLDIDVRNLYTLFKTNRITQENLMLHDAVGALTVKPNYINRNNYIFNRDKPNSDYIVNVPSGAPNETVQEINKRIFELYPNEFQIYTKENFSNLNKESFFLRGQANHISASSDYPILTDLEFSQTNGQNESAENREIQNNENFNSVRWIVQNANSGNVEWFLMQKYGNFANEPFWVNIIRNRSQAPFGPQGKMEKRRYIIYGNDKKIDSYFAFRIGWTDSEKIKYMKSDDLLEVENKDNVSVGPYDIVFPINGIPFIYDHQGNQPQEDSSTTQSSQKAFEDKKYVYKKGIAIDAPNEWRIEDSLLDIKLYFYVLRGKLVITSNYTEVPWVFPSTVNAQTNTSSSRRYQNFFIPPGKVCFFGRGFSWRMSFNPTEFNIYDAKGKDFEQERGYHGKLKTSAIVERVSFPSEQGGWRDCKQYFSNTQIYSGKKGIHNFTVFPGDVYREPSQTDPNKAEELSYVFGWDVVSEPYFGANNFVANGNVTSMMISVNKENLFLPKTGSLNSCNPRDIVNVYLDPPSAEERIATATESDSRFGFDVEISSPNAVFLQKFPTIELCCRAPSYEFGDISYTQGISKRFASPVFWALKAVHYVPSPPEPDWIDITSLIDNISYNFGCEDLLSYNQSMNIKMIVPKDYQLKDFGIGESENTYTDSITRDNFIDFFYSGVVEIDVALGWLESKETKEPSLYNGFYGNSEFGIFRGESRIREININGHKGKVAPVFRGLAYAGPLKQTFSEDVIDLTCKDFLTVLEHQIILNSPIYDGMATDNAFYHISTLAGLPRKMFDVRSASAWRHMLPMGYTFQNPKIKFEKNTTLLSAIKQICKYFMHTLRSDPDGKVVIGDVYHSQEEIAEEKYLGVAKKINELPLSHPSYAFYVDGGFGWRNSGGPPNPWQRCYESFTFDKSIQDQVTHMLIVTIDRNEGALLIDGTTMDLNAIENPSAKNFIGYSKQAKFQMGAIGDKNHFNMLKKTFGDRVFVSPLKVNFTTYGRPTIRPLDIIGVYHTHDLKLKKGKNESVNFMKYRVINVQGNVQWDDGKYQYRTDIVAEHL